jgi:hypothetical protein
MVPIMPTSRTSGSAATSRARTGGSAFSLPTEGSPAAPGVAAAAGLDALGGMLALQEATDPVLRDRSARRHGQALLAALAALQRALLADGGEDEALERVAALAHVPDAADPQLRAVLHQAGLRAAVELAKRGRSGG